jgi:hypothetical protein
MPGTVETLRTERASITNSRDANNSMDAAILKTTARTSTTGGMLATAGNNSTDMYASNSRTDSTAGFQQ